MELDSAANPTSGWFHLESIEHSEAAMNSNCRKEIEEIRSDLRRMSMGCWRAHLDEDRKKESAIETHEDQKVFNQGGANPATKFVQAKTNSSSITIVRKQGL
ncbi:hypothetical protein L1987_01057 [Smallanthus sonchifolius]|uniref:Uncharacterized protein n=1 Tax=Smallanthus sonchifolius TaxID=185202 RepID=A0ACB9K3V1_9ASTR|nr:hypothetical protein L1987_01057 [Smallanthus sonchifolius]